MDHTIATDRDNTIVRLDIQFLSNVNSVALIFRIYVPGRRSVWRLDMSELTLDIHSALSCIEDRSHL